MLIFLHEDYRHIDSAHPETLLFALKHGFGILMLACIAWLMIEMALLLISPMGMHRSSR